MNINELEAIYKEYVRFEPHNEIETYVLELIAAYREAIAEIKCCSNDEYFDGHDEFEGSALDTARRLGVE